MLQRVWSWIQNPVGKAGVRPGLVLLYVLAAGWIVAKISDYHVPHFGYTYLIGVGEEPPQGIDWASDRDVVVYRHFRSPGYDAQYYAQIAIDPGLQDPVLAKSIDNLPYRARRILLPWTAYLFGVGQPNWVLNVFALQNLVCWFLLGWLLLRWFPPTDLDRAMRWLGIMLSIGVLFSVFAALVDAPSLLLLALGLKWIETGHPWRATAVLAMGGLAKETNLLGAAGLAPANWKSARGWGMAILQGILVALPFVVWFAILRWRFGDTGGSLAGVRNFSLPFVAFAERWAELASAVVEGNVAWKYLGGGLATHISVTVQAAFLLCWWRWSSAAWRLTVPFAVLALVLGTAVWEGHPGASSRVLLPLLLGFNLLLPKGRRWWALLLLGNLTMFFGPVSLEPRTREIHTVLITNRAEVAEAALPQGELRVDFPRPWHRAESDGDRQWRWSEGDAAIEVFNPYDRPVEVEIRGQWSVHTDRLGQLKQGDTVLWQEHLTRAPTDWRVSGVVLPPGRSELWVTSDQAPAQSNPADPRKLSVRLLKFAVKGRVLD
ncbi:hypothetical protein [Actomonas aquatica]|uniref:DUF2029 domain-containing protein n=1 Tax=Actomonas aquatica TaxID=2866162 RepID=A0ABZ1CE18_9BACT|nr:hypothetical protein [Opitutus sp. WL0086]WRQ88530.1 hypothetical protein K1X11_003885 [Opitutus sp. WL0086]